MIFVCVGLLVFVLLVLATAVGILWVRAAEMDLELCRLMDVALRLDELRSQVDGLTVQVARLESIMDGGYVAPVPDGGWAYAAKQRAADKPGTG